MPELGRITREQAAALAGHAPFDDDRGSHRGQRHIAGGRSRPRRLLCAAALPAAFRWNPALKSLYARLTAAGKPHATALVACARKLILFANTVVQRGTPWQPQLERFQLLLPGIAAVAAYAAAALLHHATGHDNGWCCH